MFSAAWRSDVVPNKRKALLIFVQDFSLDLIFDAAPLCVDCLLMICGLSLLTVRRFCPWSLSLQFPGACQSSGRARLWQPWPKIVLYFIVQHDKMGGGSDEGGHQLWILKRKGGTQRSQRVSSQFFLGKGSLRCLSSYPCTLKSRENTALGFSDQKVDKSSDFFFISDHRLGRPKCRPVWAFFLRKANLS